MKKTLLIICIGILLICVTACNKDGEQAKEKVQAATNDKTYLIETYGLDPEELDGIDAYKLIDDYGLYERDDFTTEDVREILAYYGDIYHEGYSSEKDRFLISNGTEKIPEGIAISRLGYIYNAGTMNERVLFDLNAMTVQTGYEKERSMTEQEANKIKNLVTEYQLNDWEIEYEYHGSTETTASLGWKIVVEAEDKSIYTSEGYTEDFRNMPPNFAEAFDAMRNITLDN